MHGPPAFWLPKSFWDENEHRPSLCFRGLTRKGISLLGKLQDSMDPDLWVSKASHLLNPEEEGQNGFRAPVQALIMGMMHKSRSLHGRRLRRTKKRIATSRKYPYIITRRSCDVMQPDRHNLRVGRLHGFRPFGFRVATQGPAAGSGLLATRQPSAEPRCADEVL